MTTTNDNERKDNSTDELTKLNKLFAKRYTDEDKEYIETAPGPDTPPIVDDLPQERHTSRPQRFDHNNQRRYHANRRQGNWNYSDDRRDNSNDRREYRDDPNDRPQYRNYSRDQWQGRYYSNDHRHNRNFSSYNRRDRSRSPPYRQTRP